MWEENGLHGHFSDLANNPKSRTLYHCINKPICGDALLPTCQRTVNGQQGNYLFAATHLSKALAFAFDYNKDCPDIICNGAIAGTSDEFAVICKREKTLREMPLIEVYAFDAANFQEAWPGMGRRQFVSREPMPLAKTKLVLKTNKAEDLMRHGLQIFSTEKTFAELGGAAFLNFGKELSSEEWLMQLLQTNQFRWENQERIINPTIKLSQVHGNSQPKPVCAF